MSYDTNFSFELGPPYAGILLILGAICALYGIKGVYTDLKSSLTRLKVWIATKLKK